MTEENGQRSPTVANGGSAAPSVAHGVVDARTTPTTAPADYRSTLRSRRWDAAPLANPEVGRTDARITVAVIAALSGVTFVLLILGYATGFWG